LRKTLYVKPFFDQVESQRKIRRKRDGEMVSMRHEPVYHAAVSCQAASLSLTALRLRGLFWACQIESQKNGGFLARVESDQRGLEPLSRLTCMVLLRLLKGGSLIALVMPPHGKDDPDPHVCQRSYCDGMTLAFSSLALVVVSGPRLTLGGLPSKLLQDIAQRFDTAHTSMSLAIGSALKEDRRSATQSLQTAGTLVPLSIVPDFCQQSRSQAFACTRQARKDGMVRMGQKNLEP
jgi:hypothetical protein